MHVNRTDPGKVDLLAPDPRPQQPACYGVPDPMPCICRKRCNRFPAPSCSRANRSKSLPNRICPAVSGRLSQPPNSIMNWQQCQSDTGLQCRRTQSAPTFPPDCHRARRPAGGADNETRHWWHSLLPAFPSAQRRQYLPHDPASAGQESETSIAARSRTNPSGPGPCARSVPPSPAETHGCAH